MPRLVNNMVTAVRVRAASERGILIDVNGLMLRVQRSGAKNWIRRIIILGKYYGPGIGAAWGEGTAAMTSSSRSRTTYSAQMPNLLRALSNLPFRAVRFGPLLSL